MKKLNGANSNIYKFKSANNRLKQKRVTNPIEKRGSAETESKNQEKLPKDQANKKTWNKLSAPHLLLVIHLLII